MRKLQLNAGDMLLTWIPWNKKKEKEEAKQSNTQEEASLRMNKPDWNKGARPR